MSKAAAPHPPRDEGDVFDTDGHRRILGLLRVPAEPGPGFTQSDLLGRVAKGGLPLHELTDMSKVLKDLVKDGYAEEADGVYTMTDLGFDTLTGPIGNEPAPLTRERLMALHEAGDIDKAGVKAWEARHGQEASS